MENKFWKIVYSIVTLIILGTQTKIMIEQNRISKIQNYLTESNRESSYSAELLHIIDNVSRETYNYGYKSDSIKNEKWLNSFWTDFDILNNNPDTLRLALSPVLSNRISSYSYSIEPYATINYSGILNNKLYSPEKKRLFKYLINSYADLKGILFSIDFTHLHLTDTEIRRKYLRGLNISNSFFKECHFYTSDLSATNFAYSILSNTEFHYCKLIPSDFRFSVIDSVSFRDSYLPAKSGESVQPVPD